MDEEIIEPAEEHELRHDEKRDKKLHTKMVVDGSSVRKLAQVIRDKAMRVQAQEKPGPKTR